MKDQLKNFNKSLQILQKTHPPLAHQLAMIDPSDLEFCWTQDEEVNLKRTYEDRPTTITRLSQHARRRKPGFIHLICILLLPFLSMG
jgi:hypothetical protein